MTVYTLVLLEVSGIQDYIFSSNHLAQNIGASELVYRSTTEWVEEVLNSLALQHNYHWNDNGMPVYDGAGLLGGTGDVEVAYAGGGNAMLLFGDAKNARSFISRITRKALEDAPGMNLVAIMQEVDWHSQALSQRHQQIRGALAEKKHSRAFSMPLAGLGVTAQCVYTGMPAVGWDNDPKLVGAEEAERSVRLRKNPRLVSAEVAAKLRTQIRGRQRLAQALPRVEAEDLKFAYNFDDFVAKGESSYIAVIHADGNKMGKRFEAVIRACPAPQDNQSYVEQLRALSRSVQDAASSALQETVDYLLSAREVLAKELKIEKTHILPFRPIVFGGDDVTFVSEGRIGLALAARYLQAFSGKKLADDKTATARAGIAIVKSHYPFARAYQLAEKLAKSAKIAIPERKEDEESATCVMDWHISTTGVIDSLDKVLQREYVSSSGHPLRMRPLRVLPVRKGSRIWQRWDVLTGLLHAFGEDEAWAGKRNKLKALRDALRGEARMVELFRANYRLDELPPIDDLDDMKISGWQHGWCGYFDALEALDFYISLEPSNNKG
ncbi:MAG: hypothetical protein KDH97_06840 [Calditrichaeota bacterium]|nr:hypothetical protein [Calditrichota bacterium]MCB0289958.1 hypothetical protein [Calditrichota bacterium]MCB0295677.1 hypothetical protein [Calditrichota bacterium]